MFYVLVLNLCAVHACIFRQVATSPIGMIAAHSAYDMFS